MHDSDAVYGDMHIQEPVLLALLESPAMQRLHGVLQAGITGLIGVRAPTTRFEHSLGVAWLVRSLGGSLEEQIASLLHDISHTAFSHVIDYVFNNHHGQSFHEEEKESFLLAGELPEILRQYGYDWRAFLHEENYALLEQPAPALCADRLDYFLRDSLTLDILSAQEIQALLPHLVVHDGRIAVDDSSAARRMADAYIEADDASWSNFREVALYELTAKTIRRALEIKLFSIADLWTTDQQVWAKLQASDDQELSYWLRMISPQTQFVRDEQHPTFQVSTKLRTIDPDVVIDGKMVKLSELDAEYRCYMDRYLQSKSGVWPVRVITTL